LNNDVSVAWRRLVDAIFRDAKHPIKIERKSRLMNPILPRNGYVVVLGESCSGERLSLLQVVGSNRSLDLIGDIIQESFGEVCSQANMQRLDQLVPFR
jgi:hypothetical protein